MNNVIRLSAANTSGLVLYTSKVLFAEAAIIVGTAKKKENSSAIFLLNFWLIPPTIVAALRLNPGKIMDSTWKQPMMNDF